MAVPFRIVNTSGQEAHFQPVFELPAGWISLLPDGHLIALAPQESVMVIASFRVPADAAVGSHHVRLLGAPGGHEIGALQVVIEPHHDLAIRVQYVPPRVLAGTDFEISYQIENRSTQPATVELEIESAQAAAVRIHPQRLRLGAGASAVAVATVQTDFDQRRAYRIDLHASLRDHPDVRRSETTYTRAVAPEADVGSSAGLPVAITLGGSQVDDGQAGMVEVSSSVRDRPRGRRFDLLLRMPSGHRSAILPSQDLYRLRYATPQMSVQLGDGVYRLSSLTEPGRYGFGGQGEVRVGRFSAGAHHLQLRHGFIDHGQIGAQVGVAPIQPLLLSAQYLRAYGWQDTQVGTVRAVLTPVRGHRLEAEAGTAFGERSSGRALSVAATGYQSRFSYQAQYQEIEPGFGERLTSARTSLLSLTGRATDWLRVEGHWHGRADMGARSPATTAPLRRVEGLRMGLGLRRRTGDPRADLYAGYLHRRLERHGAGMAVERRETALELRGLLGVGPVTLGTTTEIGQVDQATLRPEPFVRLTSRAQLGFAGQEYGISLRVEKGPSVALLTARDQWQLGAFSRIELSRLTAIRVEARLNGFDYLGDRVALFGQARIEHRLADGSTIAFTGRSYSTWPSTSISSWEVGASYTIPLQIPLPARERPRLVGRVIDAETGSGIPGAEVFIGEFAVTAARDGEFRIPRPRTGVYPVRVDRHSIGVERIPTRETPTAISVTDDPPAPLVIHVARRAAVSGTVSIAEAGIRKVDLELDDGTSRLRTSTDNHGRFSFLDLTPGRWTLLIASAQLPERFHFAERSVAFVLDPGDHLELSLEATERVRPMRLVEGGVLRLSRTDPPAEPIEAAVPEGRFGAGGTQAEGSGYTWILGSYAAGRESADRIVARYRQAGYRATVLPAPYRGGTTYRVAVGHFQTRAAALRARSQLPPDAPRDLWLLRLGSD